MNKSGVRIGVDLGGTKIEALSLDAAGHELARRRIATPRNDYPAIVAAIKGLVLDMECKLGCDAMVGVGIPGTIDRRTGLVKNANLLSLNGNRFDADLSLALERQVRCANDANCLAVSEATDGAAEGRGVVFAAILGTGCGGGVALHGRVHEGPNGVGGEWGHNPLPWQTEAEYPGPQCYCGKRGCLEVWISGTGFAQDYERATGHAIHSPAIIAASERGDAEAIAAVRRYEDRVARGLAHVVNMLDPDVIVIGGGMSRVDQIMRSVPQKISSYVFGGNATTPVLVAKHGDSSGVRGAAWLWPVDERD